MADENPSGNKVFINPDGFLEIVLIGHQTGETFRQVYEEALPLMETMALEKKPLLGLFDLTQHTGYSLSSDKAALELLEKTPYDRLAMYSVPHKEVTEAIIMAIGKSHNTKLFDTRAEALAWLQT